jgi:hypothetical protein
VANLLYIRTTRKYIFVPLAAYFGPKMPKSEGFLKKMVVQGQFSKQDQFLIRLHWFLRTGGNSIIH